MSWFTFSLKVNSAALSGCNVAIHPIAAIMMDFTKCMAENLPPDAELASNSICL